ncbi:hypothetical protein Kpol_1013p14 [Vanderwaltozyma polyspora DSM 70294]|uniref:mRNA cleavage and polyadenylation factor CLP1 n=1 Tax=Vanderwaltozyma polyspora (strain ATCC 22028 / DSM 70294 / BCRC 21397 / CBS 2163 / NBRC 10782 / NRRL Y-8283 / UCD 57-17) TaxID=436907 RepID=CLP1_VANPO|nr:uncharacterized protein Kpol_1013p14 [Vanderwaltozyma polyspora DSM 70294]A7TH62.1 RecName: Full=mRNA cleavage and polyadenylation factor CLP1 [Vanderwaltozyma polyspora DSM 70294]EDO18343.1 hypothetical protein Kpol_1013p14 [Vanderwaltozyma polyspora DSM 70294]
MSILPGIDSTPTTNELFEGTNEIHKLEIEKGYEWKVEVNAESKLVIEVKSGIAEIFGTELANDIEYSFYNNKFSILAVEDVSLEWRCPEIPEQKLMIGENKTAKYVYNLHFSLEKMRAASFDGPKVMIVGGSNTGKTALARTLCSYAIKYKSYQPMFINLNPEEGIFSVAGCLTATPISDILDVQSTIWGHSMTSGATMLHSKQPLVKTFGLEHIKENQDLYLATLKQLSEVVKLRLQNDVLVHRSGCIIDTPPISVMDDDLTELTTTFKEFNVNVVILLSDEQEDPLLTKLNDKLSTISSSFNLLRLPILSGVIERDDVFKRSLQRLAIREYFYGSPSVVLSPYTIGVDFEDITVWRPINFIENPEETSQLLPTQLLPVEVKPTTLQHALVAISYADRKANESNVQLAPTLGFGLITEVNDKRRKLRILLPVPGRLPDKAMILTAYRYLE